MEGSLMIGNEPNEKQHDDDGWCIEKRDEDTTTIDVLGSTQRKLQTWIPQKNMQ